MQPKVFVTRTLLEPGLSLLKKHCQVEVWPKEMPPPKSVIIQKAQVVDGLVSFLTDSIDKEVIDACNHVKVISQVAVGYDNIDVAAATAKNIIVTNTPGILTETTADFAFALLLATARRVAEADRYVRASHWKVPWALDMMLGQDMYQRTLGIIGLGRIGQAVARRAKGFDMKLLYFDVAKAPDQEKELGIQAVSLDRLLKESDFITIHVPLTSKTQKMIGDKELRMMKPSACLVNTSRGPVIDQDALVSALKDGIIAYAGLDVFAEEPLPANHPLLSLANVILAPHIASASIQTRSKMAVMAAENCIAVLKGKSPSNPVNVDFA
ncbi:MAG: 2-hydroxyacid dehydrogenase [Candidatus Thorarchaeota archaeon]